jgi:hypothetical protein
LEKRKLTWWSQSEGWRKKSSPGGHNRKIGEKKAHLVVTIRMVGEEKSSLVVNRRWVEEKKANLVMAISCLEKRS